MAETWVINEEVDTYCPTTNISFISNNETFNSISYENAPFHEVHLIYGTTSVGNYTIEPDGYYISFIDQAYRTIIFETAPTGDLLTWLQANGTLTPPPSTADKLQDLIDIKQDIKEAIENKGADLTGVDFGGYAGKIDLLPAVVEMTQAQYDALPVYDDNTYYLIVEE